MVAAPIADHGPEDLSDETTQRIQTHQVANEIGSIAMKQLHQITDEIGSIFMRTPGKNISYSHILLRKEKDKIK